MNNNRSDNKLKVLILEPYYGGSHKRFLDGLRHLPFEFSFMTLPARKWKWRMRLSAPCFAESLKGSEKRYDRILCSTFLDVAAFRGLSPSWVSDVPLLTYFHENQFAYPVQVVDERDMHFGLTNITTALASDRVAFNSNYNLTSFLNGVEEMMKLSYDLKIDNPASTIRKKASIISPGIDFGPIDEAPEAASLDLPVIVWVHRWEHDKNPDLFFNTLFELNQEGIGFRLVVLGESFREYPAIFDEARERLLENILHFGYTESRSDYARWLKNGDIVVSTARHEFFGIATAEAVRAGCRPLLPGRLSYPELFPAKYLYNDRDFKSRLKMLILENQRLSRKEAMDLTEPFSWKSLLPVYNRWIEG